MRRVWKYKLEVGSNFIAMPKGAAILTAQNQNGAHVLWAMVDTDKETEVVQILMTGTGISLPYVPLRFIATIQDAPYAWHVFRQLEGVQP